MPFTPLLCVNINKINQSKQHLLKTSFLKGLWAVLMRYYHNIRSYLLAHRCCIGWRVELCWSVLYPL